MKNGVRSGEVAWGLAAWCLAAQTAHCYRCPHPSHCSPYSFFFTQKVEPTAGCGQASQREKSLSSRALSLLQASLQRQNFTSFLHGWRRHVRRDCTGNLALLVSESWARTRKPGKQTGKLDDEWLESIFHHVRSQSVSYLLSVQCEVLSRVS